MHGLKTIHQINREATEAAAICEKHGVALGDIPAPTGPLPEPVLVKHPQDMTDDELMAELQPADKCDGDILGCGADCCGSGLGALHTLEVAPGVVEGGVYTEGYDLPNVDESAK